MFWQFASDDRGELFGAPVGDVLVLGNADVEDAG
jgi:hypothetical protein